MINQSEYEKICKLIKKGDIITLKKYIDEEYEKGNKKYLLEASNYLLAYLDFYPQSFVTYTNEKLRNQLLYKPEDINPDEIIVSDRVSGGFILNSDELLVGDIYRKYFLKRSDIYDILAGNVNREKYEAIDKIKSMFSKVDLHKYNKVCGAERIGKKVKVYGRDFSYSHQFEVTKFDAFKILGDDSKLYVSAKNASPMLFGKSEKGKGLVLGLRMDKKN